MNDEKTTVKFTCTGESDDGGNPPSFTATCHGKHGWEFQQSTPATCDPEFCRKNELQKIFKDGNCYEASTEETEYWEAKKSCGDRRGSLAKVYDANFSKSLKDFMGLGSASIWLGYYLQ